MDEGAQDTRAGEAFEVFAWFAEAAPKAFDLADPEALVDELAELEAADDEVAAGGCAVDTCTLKRVDLDQGEVTSALVRVVRVGANPVEVAVALESTAGDCLHALDGQRQLVR